MSDEKTEGGAAEGRLSEDELRERVKGILSRIRHDRDQWDAGVAELKALFQGPQEGAARYVVEEQARKERLELQWKITEMLEATAPPPPPGAVKKTEEEEDADDSEAEEEEAEEEEDADARVVAPLRPEDLIPIYEDPRGLLIHKHRIDGRWILTQVNPMTGQPQSMELSAEQRKQVETELAQSPYWVDDPPKSPLV
jgi:hypothetical protein